MTNFSVEVPINPVSFGQTATLILFQLWKRQLQPSVFTIGNPDLSAFDNLPQDFVFWIQSGINKAIRSYKRSDPCLKLWHCNGSHSSVSDKTSLLTFLELDQISDLEQNILKNQNKVLVTSRFTQSMLSNYDIQATYCPLAFDDLSFRRLDKKYYDDGRIVFFLGGKAEKRKQTYKVLRAFVKRYGNNKDFMIHCAINNPFLKPEDQNALINQALEGRRYFNILFLDSQKTNSLMNDVYNSANISINVSGAEGFDLVLANMLGLQKHAVVLNAHVYPDYTNESMVTYIQPSGKEKAADGIFFSDNSPFGVGNIFSVTEESIIEGMEKAVERYKKNPINEAAKSFTDNFTWSKTADIILESLKS